MRYQLCCEIFCSDFPWGLLRLHKGVSALGFLWDLRLQISYGISRFQIPVGSPSADLVFRISGFRFAVKYTVSDSLWDFALEISRGVFGFKIPVGASGLRCLWDLRLQISYGISRLQISVGSPGEDFLYRISGFRVALRSPASGFLYFFRFQISYGIPCFRFPVGSPALEFLWVLRL